MLRPILVSYSISVLFIGLYQGISILYMTRTLELSAYQIGIVTGIGNIGFLIGAAISKRLTEKFGVGNIIIYSLGLIALGFLIVGIANASSPIAYLIVGQFIMSIGVPLYNVNLGSLRQAITPNDLLGRVNSVSRVFGRGGVPIGSALGAMIASVINPRTAVIIAGIGGVLAILPALRSSVIWVKTISDADKIRNKEG
nr:MFS transporter [Pontibacillus litoralis]